MLEEQLELPFGKVYKISVDYISKKVYTVVANNCESAIECAEELSEEEGLTTTGSFGVYDENMKPVDTWDE